MPRVCSEIPYIALLLVLQGFSARGHFTAIFEYFNDNHGFRLGLYPFFTVWLSGGHLTQ